MTRVPVLRAAAIGIAAAGFAVSASPASATNGYLVHCIGAYNCGMAGAGAALPTDATNAGINPALMARVPNELILSPAYFHPVRTLDAHGGLANAVGKQTSQVEDFLEGSAGVNYQLNSQFTIGASLYGSGGMLTKYASARTGAGAAGRYDSAVSYRLAHLLPTLTWAPTANTAFGFSVILGYSDFKTDMATLPGFAETTGRNERDYAYGVGFRFGALWDIDPQITLGFTASSPVWFQEFDKYQDVFLGPIDTPFTAALGVAWHATPRTDVAVDVKHIGYSAVKAIGTGPASGGFGWQSMNVFMIGLQHRLNDSWTLRAGYNYGPSPIPDNTVFANALFPAVIEHHFAAGATYRLSPRWELTGSAFITPKSEQTDDGSGDMFSAAGVGTKVDMYQYGASVGLKWKF